VLFYYTAVSETFVNDLSEEDEGGPDLVVGVVGFQWNWQFNYESFNGEEFGGDGDLQPLQVTGRPGAPAELVLPADSTVRFVETSPDVIHSFFVPQFLFKRDVVPGRVNQFELTVEREGLYIGRCAEFCGVDHDRMNFQVRVVPPEQFELYTTDPAAFYEQFAPDPRVVPGNDPLGTAVEAAAEPVTAPITTAASGSAS
jgi:cytochrome c oxidase subunit 2